MMFSPHGRRRSNLALLIVGFLCIYASQFLSAAVGTTAVIHAQPLHSGRISPMLFGNFVELLDDVVPSMWAEMLNDRDRKSTRLNSSHLVISYAVFCLKKK